VCNEIKRVKIRTAKFEDPQKDNQGGDFKSGYGDRNGGSRNGMGAELATQTHRPLKTKTRAKRRVSEGFKCGGE